MRAPLARERARPHSRAPSPPCCSARTALRNFALASGVAARAHRLRADTFPAAPLLRLAAGHSTGGHAQRTCARARARPLFRRSCELSRTSLGSFSPSPARPPDRAPPSSLDSTSAHFLSKSSCARALARALARARARARTPLSRPPPPPRAHAKQRLFRRRAAASSPEAAAASPGADQTRCEKEQLRPRDPARVMRAPAAAALWS